MTPRQNHIYEALTDDFDHPDVIARRAKITTVSPRETASKFGIQLTKLGKAERGGSKQFPQWRRK